MLYALDLFSGIGGNSIGLSDYVSTVAYCEADRHAQAVLLSRMESGDLPRSPICTDVTRLDGRQLKGFVDIIIAGFPCQDISCAGKGKGLAGERSGLFFEIVRLAKEIEPRFLFLENVPAIRTRGLDTVIQELTEAGYDCRWTMLSAAEVGAPHKRERWFCLAFNSDGQGTNPIAGFPQRAAAQSVRSSALAHGDSERRGSKPWAEQNRSTEVNYRDWWTAEPDLGRMANGVPQRVDRIKRLGNAVVPEQARKAFEVLMRSFQS